jgi:hypothetical protein
MHIRLARCLIRSFSEKKIKGGKLFNSKFPIEEKLAVALGDELGSLHTFEPDNMAKVEVSS